MRKSIYIAITLLAAVTLCCFPFVKLPISSSSRGFIRSAQENAQIMTLVSGKVIKSILDKNNQIIRKGDTLIVITAEQLDTQKSLQNTQSSDYAAQLSDLTKITSGQFSGLQTGQYQKEVSAFQQRIAEVQTQFALSKEELNRATLLYKQGVIPKSDYDKIFYQHQGLQSQLSGIREQQIASWQAQKRETERHIRSLSSEIVRIDQEQKNYFITAPVSGRLVNFSGITEGNFLVQGHAIGEIAPEEALVAECMVSPKDIGFIKLNQKVKFQMDPYNYNQWGFIDGKVADIDQNIIINQQTGEAFFKVRVLMEKDFLQLKNGYKGKIGKGMTFTARFHLTERTLWQLMFDRIDDWFNPNLS